MLGTGIPCPHSGITGATIQMLAVEYQLAINNANIKYKIHGMCPSLNILIIEARKMYEMSSLGHDFCVDHN